MVDLRSDAVTQPMDAMWEAMRGAKLGWAYAGEDPSVNELQAYAAELAGKEAALFVPTGTMANLLALMTHAQRGEQVIAEASSHILWSEEWGYAHICGLAARPIQGQAGRMDPEQVQDAITEERHGHRPRTGLICVENSHNMAGGTIIHPEQMAGLARVARECGIPMHLDGARILNAAEALRCDLRILAGDADTLAMSLTKGLCAPLGALLCGPREFIERCKVNLRRLGGWSLHKAGIYAVAGLVALRTMLPQLAEDNRRARVLGAGLAALGAQVVSPAPVETNIVVVHVDRSWMSARALLDRLAQRGIRGSLRTVESIRFVTHRHVSDGDVHQVIAVVDDIVRRSG